MHRSFIFCTFLGVLLCIFTQNAYSVQGVQSDKIIYENWLSVQNIVQNLQNDERSFRSIVGEGYLDLYERTNNEVYLNFALHEELSDKRHEIIDQLSSQERRNVSDVVEKLVRGNFVDEYFSIRDFSASDIYTFHGPAIPSNKEDPARELLDHWLSSLPQDYEENSLEASLKAQALVLGYDKLDDFDKVFEVGQYLKRSHPFPNSSFTFYLFNIITYASRARGYYSEALDIFTNTLLPMAEALEYTDRYLTIKMDYALTLFSIGDVNASLQEFEDVYSQGIQNLDPRYRPALLNNLAISYLNSGQFDQYVQFQLEAFDIARQEENYNQQLRILSNLFNFHRRQNENNLAFNYLNQALEIAQENNLLSETASILLSLGVYERETENDLEEALSYFHDALKVSNDLEDYRQQVNSLFDLSETYQLLRDYQNAETYIVSAIKLSQSREDDRSFTQAVVRYGNLLTESGNFAKAESIMDQLTQADLQQVEFYLKVLGYSVNIKILTNKGEYTEARELSSSIIEEILAWLQESTDLQTGHMRMDQEFSEAFQLHTELLYELGDYEEALTVTGRLRNLSRTGFYNNPLLKSQILSEEELIKDYNLSNRIEDLRARYANANEEQKIYISNELAAANAERNNLLNKAFPNYSASDFEEILPRAMTKLQSDQLVIYFSILKDQIFQYLVSSNDIDVRAYPADSAHLGLLENAVESFGHASTDLHMLHDVYKTFFDGKIPSGIKHIYMIPDGVFYRMPIEILPVEPVNSSRSYGSSTYLIEQYSVSYLNTLSDLVNEPKNSSFAYDMAGFGVSNFTDAGHPHLSDLPFSPREVTSSVEQLDKFNNNRFFINDRSTELNFRNIAGKAKIIHLATHSKVDDENPLFSSLYMHSGTTESEGDSLDNENDGIVHAYELFDLNLNADLIFLSSCESGSGGYLKGSGILGFSRAFTYAGAQSLSINLWPIRDQTASEISTQFYASLNDGKNKADALRNARLHYLNNSNSDPYLWGAFIIYGNITPTVKSYQTITQIFLSGLIVTGLFFIVFFVYQNKTLIRSWIF